jgi:hypothetical protein
LISSRAAKLASQNSVSSRVKIQIGAKDVE